ncbi:hypothetical protein [Kytococcus sedentarius]|uniref:hypothetical protein n=1 Tax=Kytococcus sedentarius TaxID=1276 RepID=UPI0035BC5C9F
MSDNVVATTTHAAAPESATHGADDDGIKKHRMSPAAHAALFIVLGILLTLFIIGIWPLMEVLGNDVDTSKP